jgi:hypothetical protein
MISRHKNWPRTLHVFLTKVVGAAADKNVAGVLFQKPELAAEPVSVAGIVSIHSSNVPSAHQLQGSIQSSDYSGIFLTYDFESSIMYRAKILTTAIS